jgi:hypothetical protein
VPHLGPVPPVLQYPTYVTEPKPTLWFQNVDCRPPLLLRSWACTSSVLGYEAGCTPCLEWSISNRSDDETAPLRIQRATWTVVAARLRPGWPSLGSDRPKPRDSAEVGCSDPGPKSVAPTERDSEARSPGSQRSVGAANTGAHWAAPGRAVARNSEGTLGWALTPQGGQARSGMLLGRNSGP